MAGFATALRRFAPNLEGASLRGSGHDAVAGLTVAALAVPQGVAYALIAGLPPEMGLMAAALPAVCAALFGSCTYLVTGPTIPIALLVGVSIVEPAVAATGAVPIGAVLQTALLAGAALVVLGLFGFGRASRFLSDSVVAGFALGVGVLIVLRHVPGVLGVSLEPAAVPAHAPRVWGGIVDAARALALVDPRALALGFGVPVVVVALNRFDPRIPSSLIALGLAAGVATLAGWSDGETALATLQTVSLGWPSLHPPGAIDFGAYAPSALAIALLATVQTIAAARTLEPNPHRIDPDRELFAQGVGNLAAGLLGALPTSGSLTRSAVARTSGGRSRLAGVVAGLVVAGLLPLLAPLLQRLPLPALAGFVVFSGLSLINPTALLRAATTRGDALILAVTFVTTLWMDLVQAVYAGVFISLALLVRRAGRLQMVEVVHVGPGKLREIPIDDATGRSPVVILHLEGDLNFAVAPELADQLVDVAERAPEILILRLKRARHLDATVLEVLRTTLATLRARGATMMLCGLTDPVATSLERTELGRELGPEGVLRTGPRLFEGFERALQQARKRLEPRSDPEIFRWHEPATWSYEI